MDRIFFEIIPRPKGTETTYLAKLQISDLVANQQPDLVKRVESLEKLYKETVSFCRVRIERIKKIKDNKRLLLYWEMAHNIGQYLKISEEKGFFLNNYYKHFCRDIKISRETLKRLMKLIKAVGNKAALDTSKSWSYYTRRYCRAGKGAVSR